MKIPKNRKSECKFLTNYYSDLKDHDDEIFLYCTYPEIRENRYVISNYGKFISFKSNKVLSYYIDKDGYHRLTFKNKDGKNKNTGTHRLVAWEYCKKHDGYDVVNHLDCDKTNNYYKNLEWTTVQGNTLHAIAHGLTTRAGCNAPGAKFEQEFVEKICEQLESGMDIYSVYEYYYPYSTVQDHKDVYILIYRLKTDSRYLYPVRDKYNIPTENISSSKPKWKKEDSDKIEKMIRDGKTNKEIMSFFGFRTSKEKGGQRYIDKVNHTRKQIGIEDPDVIKNRELVEKLTKMVKNGMSNKEILNKAGVTANDLEGKVIISRLFTIRKHTGIKNTTGSTKNPL